MLFFKKVIADDLYSVANKKQLTVWKAILKQLKKQAKIVAKKGEFKLVVEGSKIKCEYIKNRTQDLIIEDVKKMFTGCTVNYGTNSSNQFIIEINWKK